MQGPDTKDAGRPGSAEEPAQVCYVFAVGREGEPLTEAARGLTGPTSSAVRTVYGSGLGALVCSVPAGLYDEEGLRAQLEDLERLESLARSHHAVVAAAYEHTTVLPMRLATVYLDDSRVTEMLEERSSEFDALLAKLEGHLEWGVKIYADPRAAAAPAEESASDSPASGSSPGRDYLQRRRKQRNTHRDAYRAAGAVAERVTALADGLATAKVSHRPQQGELASGPGENTANDAYLVSAERSEDFRAALSGLAEDVPGVRVELTGPWAPYSFATPPSSPQPEAGSRQG
ncbi:GvpL/GvpF family gas vesicle protein [Streptomyces albidus (ex Kaewkla and Franco 2022)]|uniref:GvpL/GvpF family gas vesicle protein n=1 Tax=Streptomyces albidus (ex Kaewkla and Franco 2022) TaxID=722709 RepID=UPI002816100F|nr:GvpL/GvpF family gas vesicle protein [Streptomyces albidus (ex Kaewkla and Franco 2022)]